MMGENPCKDKSGGKFAEVFSPANVVFEMLLHDGFIPLLKGLEKTFLDPCCGQGQFGCSILVLKMFYCLLDLPPKQRPNAVLRILLSIYSMDIQDKNCTKTREHLLKTVYDAYNYFFDDEYPLPIEAANIICGRVMCGNSLEYMHYLVPPSERDAQWKSDHKELLKHKHIHEENSSEWQQQRQILLKYGFITDENVTGQTTLF